MSSSVLLLLATALAGAAAGGESVERRLAVMGTSLSLEVAAGDRAAALKASEAAVRAIEDTERRLSTWRAESELARLNRAPVGAQTALSEATAADLGQALACAEATAGAFDLTVGALVDAWDLRGAGRIPAGTERAEALRRVGHGLLSLEGQTAVRRADLRVEEGGFGKGAALDRAMEALRRGGATWAWLDLGGQVAVSGKEVVVSIAHPAERGTAALELVLGAGSASTTGNSERGRVVDGERVGHLLDPRSGAPARDFGSVTVVAKSAAWADCLSTALFVLGPSAALEWARRHEGVEVVVLEPVEGGLRARASAGLRHALRASGGAGVLLEFDDGEGEGEER